MNIHLHIERMVLDGLPVSGGEAANVQAAVEAELARLLAGELVAPHSSSAVGTVAGGEIRIPPRMTARQLGGEIGRSVFRNVTASRFDSDCSTQNNKKGN
jgi:hypothetical protein